MPSLTEELEPDLDEVLDFRFATIEAELFVVLQHLGAVEPITPSCSERTRETGAKSLPELDLTPSGVKCL